MYKPPQNSNRVKLIRKKFENVQNNESRERKTEISKDRDNLISNGESDKRNSDNNVVIKKPLQRHPSDPVKINIKRTPAFRLERSVERSNSNSPQRNRVNQKQSTLFESKVKQFSAVRNHCDSNSNFFNNDKSETKPLLDKSNDVPLIKSKSALDFKYIKNTDKDITNIACNNCHDSTNDKKNIDLSLLYTEPIPKALRRNNSNCTDVVSNTEQLESIYNASTIIIEDKEHSSLTDTLKVALSRPLPSGPAPKKPPRTFQVPQDSIIPKNNSFLHDIKIVEKKSIVTPKTPTVKSDPKYMLNKLEDALRNNKLKPKRPQKIDLSVTSGEESDDSLLYRSKSNRTLPRLPSQEYGDNSAFNFNCLNGLKFALANYEKIKEPNSCFFVGSPQEEPVYAEPFHFRKDSLGSAAIKREGSSRSKQSARNSLYYMSTPILTTGEKLLNNMTESPDQQLSAENSSLSSFTSDMDTPSPIEESSKIRTLIDCYESRSSPVHQNGHTPNRLEDLKTSLRQTIDTSFEGIGAVKETDSENEGKVADIVKKFETYRQTMPKYCSTKVGKEKLFYCCLIIEKVKDMARIKFKYPSNAEIPQSIEHLCFPESESLRLDDPILSQNYSLLITNEKGERTYGYCRRVLPEGSSRCLPLAYCILSKYRAPRFYKKIMVELESRHGIPNKFRDELISQFYNQKFPKPGDSIRINLNNIEPNVYKTDDKENSISKGFEESLNLGSYVHVNTTSEYIGVKKNAENTEQIFLNQNDVMKRCSTPSYIAQTMEKNELVLTLHPDTRFEDSDLKVLHQLPADVLLKIFSSMLLERKVVLISSMISKLSSCIDSLQSILFPFTWHHTCIPILPESLWDIVESPTPVICGVLCTDVLELYQIENGIVVDLDTGTVKKKERDENKILPDCMQKVWKRSLALANRASSSMEYVHSVYLSDAYLQVFIMCFKDYKKFFKDGVFLKDKFMKTKSGDVKRFLKMFTETYMFLAFVDTVVNTPENLVEFDRKIEMYGSEESNVILDKLLEWHR